MSQPHPIKLRSRLPSKDSVTSLYIPQATQPKMRRRSKSEPARLAHEDIRQNFSKEISSECSFELFIDIEEGQLLENNMKIYILRS